MCAFSACAYSRCWRYRSFFHTVCSGVVFSNLSSNALFQLCRPTESYITHTTDTTLIRMQAFCPYYTTRVFHQCDFGCVVSTRSPARTWHHSPCVEMVYYQCDFSCAVSVHACVCVCVYVATPTQQNKKGTEKNPTSIKQSSRKRLIKLQASQITKLFIVLKLETVQIDLTKSLRLCLVYATDGLRTGETTLHLPFFTQPMQLFPLHRLPFYSLCRFSGFSMNSLFSSFITALR